MFTKVSKALATGAVAAGVFGAIIAPTSAHAATSHDTIRRHVCAQNVYLREQPKGVSIGQLDNGDTFDQERLSPSGAWAYGMAYGNANKHGWVQESALC